MMTMTAVVVERKAPPLAAVRQRATNPLKMKEKEEGTVYCTCTQHVPNMYMHVHVYNMVAKWSTMCM